MRSLFAAAVLGGLVFASAAQAEKRVFIIANSSDGYGIDRCLASGAQCGAAAANSYCKNHEFASAASYRKVDREEITGAIPSGGGSGCKGSDCDGKDETANHCGLAMLASDGSIALVSPAIAVAMTRSKAAGL